MPDPAQEDGEENFSPKMPAEERAAKLKEIGVFLPRE
jgi:hypothetical protein